MSYWDGVLIMAERLDPSKPGYIQAAIDTGRITLIAAGLDPATFEVHLVWRQKRGAPPPPPPPLPVPGHNFAPRTHQGVINLFFSVAPRHPGTGSGWDWIVRAGIQFVGQDRSAIYSGPDIEALTLPDEQKAALIAAP